MSTLAVIGGVAIPYGRICPDRAERFIAGAFRRSLAERPGCYVRHTHSGRRSLAEREAGTLRLYDFPGELRFEMDLIDTQEGREVLWLLRRRALCGASIEFTAVRDRWAGGVREVMEADLFGIALTSCPAYPTEISIRYVTQHGLRYEDAARRRRLRLAEAGLSLTKG